MQSVADWAGGRDALRRLTLAFYRKVPDEPLLAPLFGQMDLRHAEHVADFIAEVFGGPPVYCGTGGSHIGMIVKHLGRGISEAQRVRWAALMIETADEVGLPQDPAFSDALVDYLEGGLQARRHQLRTGRGQARRALAGCRSGAGARRGHRRIPAATAPRGLHRVAIRRASRDTLRLGRLIRDFI